MIICNLLNNANCIYANLLNCLHIAKNSISDKIPSAMRKYIFNLVFVCFALVPHFLCSYTSADRIKTHLVETEYQNGTQEIRVLLPDDYQDDKQYRVLYVLPVEKGFDKKYGFALGVLRKMNAHNIYDIIIVQMGFEKEPWYADHATDLHTRQASYLKDFVVPFIEKHYSTLAASKGRLLFGFSKSGFGAFSLILTYTDFFGYAASWDAPMFLDKFYFKMKPIFGTLAQLNKFRPDLLVPKKQQYFNKTTRLVLSGEKDWGKAIPTPTGDSHTTAMHKLLLKHGIKHIYNDQLNIPHRWDKRWMTPTLHALMQLTQDPPPPSNYRDKSITK